METIIVPRSNLAPRTPAKVGGISVSTPFKIGGSRITPAKYNTISAPQSARKVRDITNRISKYRTFTPNKNRSHSGIPTNLSRSEVKSLLISPGWASKVYLSRTEHVRTSESCSRPSVSQLVPEVRHFLLPALAALLIEQVQSTSRVVDTCCANLWDN